MLTCITPSVWSHAPLGSRQPDERQANRVHLFPGLIREERQVQAALRQRRARVLPHDAKEDTPGLLRRWPDDGPERQRIQVEGEPA